jgi:pimeloyl-ACP methyl ester carboxylesterase
MSRRALMELAYWLGPWTTDDGVPSEVATEDVDVPPSGTARRPMRARVFRPTGRDAEGSLLLVQGLHYAGPDDPRMDRFARIVAASGIVVLAPFLPDFAALRVADTLVGDTRRAFLELEEMRDRPVGRPGIFSISFGSMPALRIAADPGLASRVGGLCCFGGYADFRETIRFALLGRPGLAHDPLNRPVVFINLVDHLEGVPADPTRLLSQWEAFVHATWGRPELKDPARYRPIARGLAEALPEEQRALFLAGCDAAPGGEAAGLSALRASADSFAFLDPRPHLSAMTCPVHIVHGRDDDVIPFTEAEKIRHALPDAVRARVWLTGLYAHTGSSGLWAFLQKARLVPSELRSLVGILRAIHGVATTKA